MNKEKHLIYLPGLHDQFFLNKFAIKILPFFWRVQGYKGHILYPHWEERKNFLEIQDEIVSKIDVVKTEDNLVYLAGQSAGSSIVANAYCQRKNDVVGVAIITGRLRRGENVSPTLDVAAKDSQAFKQSVETFEDVNEPNLTKADRKKFITIRPYLDKIVPSTTVPLNGATNILAPIIDHTLGGMFISSFYSWRIFNFFESLSKTKN